jgi:hypothetical protein
LGRLLKKGNSGFALGHPTTEVLPMTKHRTLSIFLLRGLIPAALMLVLACPADIFAQPAPQEHLVTPQTMQQQLQSASQARQANIKTVTDFLSTPTADRAMRDGHFDPVQVRTAIPTLSDQELANLASRSASAQQRISAGALGFGLTVILIIAIVIIIVVAIKH